MFIRKLKKVIVKNWHGKYVFSSLLSIVRLALIQIDIVLICNAKCIIAYWYFSLRLWSGSGYVGDRCYTLHPPLWIPSLQKSDSRPGGIVRHDTAWRIWVFVSLLGQNIIWYVPDLCLYPYIFKLDTKCYWI